jgi:hypothetical protein
MILTSKELPMKVLHLTLKKKWFDMIASGEKKEEYREYNHYWVKRLFKKQPMPEFNEYDAVQFANGGHFGNVPKITMKLLGIAIDNGRLEWGAEPDTLYFVIKLGERIS